MKRKVLIGGIVLVALSGGAYGFMQPQNDQISSDTLSARSQEYLESRKKADDGVWRNVVTTPREKRLMEEVSLKNCFSITIPFEVRYVREEGNCVQRIGLLNPTGGVVMQIREGTFASLIDVPDVVMRRSKSDVYQERFVTANGVTYLSFVNTQEGYEQTAFRLTERGVLSVSLSTVSSENLGEEFDTMIKTLNVQ